MKVPKQLEFPSWGGKRNGAGRPRLAARPMVSHRRRPSHAARFPLHAVLRTVGDVPRLRQQAVFLAVKRALSAGAERERFRVVHCSVQGNHIHLVVEAADREALSRGMQGLAIRMARAINRAASRKGRVFADHYFARELRTPAEVRRAVRYVLDNFILHARLSPQTDARASSLAPPRTWLLSIGWHRSRAGPLPVAYWSK